MKAEKEEVIAALQRRLLEMSQCYSEINSQLSATQKLLAEAQAEISAASSAPAQRGAARVVLYVNGTPFVCALHMSITPSFNPSLCLGSGTFPVARVQGLAARVAVTAPNLQRACSSVTYCCE